MALFNFKGIRTAAEPRGSWPDSAQQSKDRDCSDG